MAFPVPFTEFFEIQLEESIKFDVKIKHRNSFTGIFKWLMDMLMQCWKVVKI